MTGSRKVDMLKRTQWFIAGGFIVVALLALTGTAISDLNTPFLYYLAGVTGNLGIFVAGNAAEHKHDNTKVS